MRPDYRTRFAPSPTGPLHLGHAYSALLAEDRARRAGGAFLLRIEDTDTARCRPAYEAAIHDILGWLGLRWQPPVLRQSDHLARYRAALGTLIDAGLCYPCACSRSDIRAAFSAPQEGAGHFGPDDPIYPGTCRGRGMAGMTSGHAVRLDIAKAIALLGDVGQLTVTETGPDRAGVWPLRRGELIDQIGDVVLARRDTGIAAYHLAVVVDDAAQGITEVVRGADIFEATKLHRLLQALLKLPVPDYHHHSLIRDDQGKRLAKRDDARALSKFRADGATPEDIRRLVGL